LSGVELRVPPPAVALLAAAFMWLVARALPVLDFHIPARGQLAIAIAVIGLAIAAFAFFQFRRAGTTVNPMRPAESAVLVTTGIYRFSRNPMYVGDVVLLAAWAVWLANLAALIGLLLFVAYISRFQITLEERALEARFGAAYVEYRRSVRRWI
jgi:protein-S-isoprenylcysteine O-methyltransferase Ste14